MASKAVDPETKRAVAAFVEKMIADLPARSDGKAAGPTDLSEAMRKAGHYVAQSAISEIKNQTGSVGLRVVMDLASYGGCSVDEVLGRARPAGKTAFSEAEAAALRSLIDTRKARRTEPPKSTTRLTQVEQEIADAKRRKQRRVKGRR